MQLERFTQKAQEAIVTAQQLAERLHSPLLDAEHILSALVAPDGSVRHAEARIGDSVVMISDAGSRSPMTAFLYVYVNDTDGTYRRALDAGARALEAPSVMPYGDRRCMVEDKWGNTWQIATHLLIGPTSP